MPSFRSIATKQHSPKPPKHVDVSLIVHFGFHTFRIQTLEKDVESVPGSFERIHRFNITTLQQSDDNPGQHEALDMFLQLRQVQWHDDRINE